MRIGFLLVNAVDNGMNAISNVADIVDLGTEDEVYAF